MSYGKWWWGKDAWGTCDKHRFGEERRVIHFCTGALPQVLRSRGDNCWFGSEGEIKACNVAIYLIRWISLRLYRQRSQWVRQTHVCLCWLASCHQQPLEVLLQAGQVGIVPEVLLWEGDVSGKVFEDRLPLVDWLRPASVVVKVWLVWVWLAASKKRWEVWLGKGGEGCQALQGGACATPLCLP